MSNRGFSLSILATLAVLLVCCVDYDDGESSAFIKVRKTIVFDTTDVFGVSDLTSILWEVQQPDGRPGPTDDRQSQYYSYAPTQIGLHRINVSAATPSSLLAHTILLQVTD